jgi:hypothetical protein
VGNFGSLLLSASVGPAAMDAPSVLHTFMQNKIINEKTYQSRNAFLNVRTGLEIRR